MIIEGDVFDTDTYGELSWYLQMIMLLYRLIKCAYVHI